MSTNYNNNKLLKLFLKTVNMYVINNNSITQFYSHNTVK